MIRKFATLLFVIVLSASAIADDQSDALLPVHRFVNGMNNGDLDSAFSACSAGMVIIDNVAPYNWQGENACQRWAESQEADSIRKGVTDAVFSLGRTLHFEVSDNHAYAVLQASYTFNVQGRAHEVEGSFTAAMQKGAAGWRLTGFAFAEQ